MKECPRCASVSWNDQAFCDMCGANLSEVPIRTLDEIEEEHASKEKRSDEVDRSIARRDAKTRIILSGFGASAILAGLAIIVYLQSLAGLLLIVLGIAFFGFSMNLYEGNAYLSPRRRR